MRRLLSDPRTAWVLVASGFLWLLLGWLWGDDWLWTVLRAFGATLTIVGIGALRRALAGVTPRRVLRLAA